MSAYHLESSEAVAEVDDNPAQIRSFRDKQSGLEYMWQGDETHWKWQNPTLFPMVGHTWDKKIRLKGQVYEMPNHGFARNFPWTTVSHEGEEFGYVLSGRILLCRADRKKGLPVRKGEVFYLRGNESHYLENNTSQTAKVLWISTPPAF